MHIIKIAVISIWIYLAFISYAGVSYGTSGYELFYPISHGIVRGDLFYHAKLFIEDIRGMVIANDLLFAEYNIYLSEKRLVEAEYLIQQGKHNEANLTMGDLYKTRDITNIYLSKAKQQGYVTNDIEEELRISLDKQRKLFAVLGIN